MSEEQVESVFRECRWPETDGEAVCPHCGGLEPYACRRASGALRYRCKACKADFSLTSGTLFASHKLPLRIYLAAIALFVNSVKGKSMLELSRDLNVNYKTAFVLGHKIREAVSHEYKGRVVGGEGKEVEIDGALVGVYVKPANRKEFRRDRRKRENLSPNRKFVVVARERGGLSTVGIFKTEGQSKPWLKSVIRKGTIIHADDAAGWNGLRDKYQMFRIDHTNGGYSIDGACTNLAESFFSRLRRLELGAHHHIEGAYLIRYARESGWREDNRQKSNGEQMYQIMGLALKAPPRAVSG